MRVISEKPTKELLRVLGVPEGKQGSGKRGKPKGGIGIQAQGELGYEIWGKKRGRSFLSMARLDIQKHRGIPGEVIYGSQLFLLQGVMIINIQINLEAKPSLVTYLFY